MDDDITEYFQGDYEVETSTKGENTLLEHFQQCSKNPGHEKFIAPDEFSLDHLPCQYRDISVFKLIKSLSDLTALITVSYTSLARPEFSPNESHPYPFYNTRGLCNLRTGSGMVWSVGKYKKNKKPCICTKCLNSKKPCSSWAEVTLVTATHLVFNDEEGLKTKCRLWHEDERSEDVNLEGFKVIGASLKRDRCVLKCVTCDREVVARLREAFVRYKRLCKTVHHKFRGLRKAVRMAVVIAHPHGRHKKISIGSWIKRKKLLEVYKLTAYTYTAPTCPGSSGAPVYTFGGKGRWWLSIHTHMGASLDGNCSGFGLE